MPVAAWAPPPAGGSWMTPATFSTGLTSRRALIKAVAAVTGAVAIAPTGVFAAPNDQGVPPGGAGPATPATTTTSPPRDFSPNGAPSTYFSDPDVITIDPGFGDITQGNTTIQ